MGEYKMKMPLLQVQDGKGACERNRRNGQEGWENNRSVGTRGGLEWSFRKPGRFHKNK